MLGLLIPTGVFAVSPITLDNSYGSTYNANQWQFIINGINNQNDAPDSIQVVWSDGTTSSVALSSFTGKVAHYAELFSVDDTHSTLRPISATADIDSELCNQFVISDGPSNATIIVIKTTDSGEAVFSFNGTGQNGLPSSFSITTSSTVPYSGTTAYNVWVGNSGATFGILEDLTGMGNWSLDSSSVSVAGTPDNFQVAPGSTVTVTFNNKLKPTEDLPELPAGALLGLGLVGVVGFLWVKRQKMAGSK